MIFPVHRYKKFFQDKTPDPQQLPPTHDELQHVSFAIISMEKKYGKKLYLPILAHFLYLIMDGFWECKCSGCNNETETNTLSKAKIGDKSDDSEASDADLE